MTRFVLAITLGMALGAGGISLARHDHQGHGKVTTLSERDVIENLDGKQARVTTVEVAYEPGEAGPSPTATPARSSDMSWKASLNSASAIEPARTLKAGETFYEPTGILHRVSRNPDPKARTRVLAVVLHPRDAARSPSPLPPRRGSDPGDSAVG